MIWERGEYRISDERGVLHLPTVHALLATTYWAGKRPPRLTELGIERSLCFSVWVGEQQVGFARVLSDGGVYAVLLDVVIAREQQGRGLGRWLLEVVCAHPEVKGLRLVLWTTDQLKFYEAAGFKHEEAFQLLGMKPDWTAVLAARNATV